MNDVLSLLSVRKPIAYVQDGADLKFGAVDVSANLIGMLCAASWVCFKAVCVKGRLRLYSK